MNSSRKFHAPVVGSLLSTETVSRDPLSISVTPISLACILHPPRDLALQNGKEVTEEESMLTARKIDSSYNFSREASEIQQEPDER